MIGITTRLLEFIHWISRVGMHVFFVLARLPGVKDLGAHVCFPFVASRFAVLQRLLLERRAVLNVAAGWYMLGRVASNFRSGPFMG